MREAVPVAQLVRKQQPDVEPPRQQWYSPDERPAPGAQRRRQARDAKVEAEQDKDLEDGGAVEHDQQGRGEVEDKV